jgi:hypothetical protein
MPRKVVIGEVDGRLAGVAATGDDPVLVRRRRIARLVEIGQRVGYGLFGLAIVVFVVGFSTEFTTAVTTAITACLLVGSVILAPAIVFGYAVRAAEREDRAAGRLTGRSSGEQDATDSPSAT